MGREKPDLATSKFHEALQRNGFERVGHEPLTFVPLFRDTETGATMRGIMKMTRHGTALSCRVTLAALMQARNDTFTTRDLLRRNNLPEE